MKTDESLQSFRNQFLIALPSMVGDYFQHTITLLVDHTSDGAFGLIINRPLENRIEELFPEISERFSCPLLEGGPVEQDKLFFLHPTGVCFESTFEISDAIALTTSPDFIEAMKIGEAPAGTLALLGYAGWGATQLESELAENVWLLSPASAAVVFDEPFETRAVTAAGHLGIDLNLVNPHAGHD